MPLPLERAAKETARPSWDGGNHGHNDGMGGEEDRRRCGRLSSETHDDRAPARPYYTVATGQEEEGVKKIN